MTKTIACLAAVLVLGVLAVWQTLRQRAGTVYPDTADSATHWICDVPACGSQVDLTARQVDELVRSQDNVRRGSQDFGQQIVLKCPRCGQFTLVRAMKCPKHGTWLVMTHADGRGGTCPDCDKEGGG